MPTRVEYLPDGVPLHLSVRGDGDLECSLLRVAGWTAYGFAPLYLDPKIDGYDALLRMLNLDVIVHGVGELQRITVYHEAVVVVYESADYWYVARGF